MEFFESIVNGIPGLQDGSNGPLDWQDEIALVALGRKPIALTHFDSLIDSPVHSMVSVLAPVVGVGCIWVPSTLVPTEMEMEMNEDIDFIVSARIQGEKTIAVSPYLQTESLIWYRDDTALDASVLAYLAFFKLDFERDIFPQKMMDVVQGILFGYTKLSIFRYILDPEDQERDVEDLQDEFEKMYQKAQDFIGQTKEALLQGKILVRR